MNLIVLNGISRFYPGRGEMARRGELNKLEQQVIRVKKTRERGSRKLMSLALRVVRYMQIFPHPSVLLRFSRCKLPPRKLISPFRGIVAGLISAGGRVTPRYILIQKLPASNYLLLQLVEVEKVRRSI